MLTTENGIPWGFPALGSLNSDRRRRSGGKIIVFNSKFQGCGSKSLTDGGGEINRDFY